MRPRFSLRLLLVVVTIAAVGAGVARLYMGPRTIAELDTEVIEAGFSEWQVRYLIGPPHRIVRGPPETWEYDIQDRNGFLEIVWRDGRVASTQNRFFIPHISW